MSDAHLDHAHLDHAQLDHAQLDHAQLDHAQLDHAQLAAAQLTTARAALDRLRAAGVTGWDPLGEALIASLIARAEGLPAGARAHLLPRIEARLEQAGAALTAARAAAEAEVASLAREGITLDEAGKDALDRGDFRVVHRGARRLRQAAHDAARPVPILWIPRLQAQAAARGLRLPPELAAGLDALDRTPGMVTRGALRQAQALGNSLSIQLFRDSLEQARASFSMARASDNVPAAAGPYNGQALSARALGAMDALSPGYLRAFLAGLDDLETVAAALVPETTKKAKATKRKKSGAATG